MKRPKRSTTINGIKMCTKCKTSKPVSEFYQRKNGYSRSWCMVCEKAISKTDYSREYHTAYSRLKLRGVTPLQFQSMLEQQGSQCAICKEPFTETPRLDHDHKTNQNRGLLCDACNKMLGLADDDPDILRNAALYIEEHIKLGEMNVATNTRSS